jgi:hypothetical protein
VEPKAPWGFINAVVSQKRKLTIIVSSGSAKCSGLTKGSRLLLWLLLLLLLILLTPGRREHPWP